MDADPSAPQNVRATDAFLRRIAHRLVRSASDAEDLAQEVWLRTLTKPPADPVLFRAWLRKVARNTLRLLKRGQYTRNYHEAQASLAREREGRADFEPLSSANEQSLRAFLRLQVESLKEPYRGVIREHFLNDKSIPELAAALGRSENTVRVQIRRGLDALRIRMERKSKGTWALLPGLGFLRRFRRGEPAHSFAVGATVIGLAGLLLVALALTTGEDASARSDVTDRAEEPETPLETALRPLVDELPERSGPGSPSALPSEPGMPGLQFEGLVLSASGERLAGAPIFLVDLESKERLAAVSASDGSYHLANVEASEWIHSQPEGYPPTPHYSALNASARLDLVASVDQGRVSGRVLTLWGTPLEGARVQLTNKIWDGLGVTDGPRVLENRVGPQGVLESGLRTQTATTDANGAFEFWKLESGPGTLIVDAGARGFELRPVDLDAPGPWVFELQSPASLEVRLEDPDGRPCVGAHVRLKCKPPFRAVLTVSDAEGVVRFSGLPSGPFLLRVLEREDAGLASGYLYGDLAHGERRLEVLGLSEEHTLSGWAVDGTRPLTGASVCYVGGSLPLELDDLREERTAKTLQDGSFTLMGLPSDASVRVLAFESAGPIAQWKGRTKDSPIHLRTDAARVRVRVNLPPGVPRPLGISFLGLETLTEVFVPFGETLETDVRLLRGPYRGVVVFPRSLGDVDLDLEVAADPTELEVQVDPPSSVAVALDLEGIAFEEAQVFARVRGAFGAKHYLVPMERDSARQVFHREFLSRVGVEFMAPGFATHCQRVELQPGAETTATLFARPGFPATLELHALVSFPIDAPFQVTCQEPFGPRGIRTRFSRIGPNSASGGITLTSQSLRLQVSSRSGLKGERILTPEDLVPGARIRVELVASDLASPTSK